MFSSKPGKILESGVSLTYIYKSQNLLITINQREVNNLDSFPQMRR